MGRGAAALSLSSQTRPRTLAQQLLRRDPEGPEADGHSDPQHCPRGAVPGHGALVVLHLPLPYRSPGECSGPGAAHAGRAGTPPRESLVEPETVLFHILSEPRYGDGRGPLVIVAELTAKSSHGQR